MLRSAHRVARKRRKLNISQPVSITPWQSAGPFGFPCRECNLADMAGPYCGFRLLIYSHHQGQTRCGRSGGDDGPRGWGSVVGISPHLAGRASQNATHCQCRNRRCHWQCRGGHPHDLGWPIFTSSLRPREQCRRIRRLRIGLTCPIAKAAQASERRRIPSAAP